MLAIRVFAVLGCSALLAAAPAAAEENACTLDVTVQGVKDSVGKVGLLVFTSDEGWPKEFDLAFRRQAVEARPGDVQLTFDDLPPGEYGVVALHDENENRKLDRNFFGVPKEGWGMSNNPEPKLSAPDFEKAAFELGCPDSIEIQLRY